jgi:hypothetical protein
MVALPLPEAQVDELLYCFFVTFLQRNSNRQLMVAFPALWFSGGRFLPEARHYTMLVHPSLVTLDCGNPYA